MAVLHGASDSILPVRIAVTHPYSWPEVRRGAERIVVEMSRGLAKRGHAVTVFTSGRTPGQTYEDRLRTVRFRRLFKDQRRHERSFGLRIVPPLLTGSFDIVHSMMPWDAHFATRFRRLGGYRVVFDEMGIPYRSHWKSLPEGRVREQLARDVDVYGCMSRHALDVLLADWGRVGELIPGGVRLDQFRPASEREPNPTILFSGTLVEPRKGLAELLEACAVIVSQVSGLRLWLSGQGDPSIILDRAPRKAREICEILPIGTPEQQGSRYGRAWVTALPSVSDSFGLVLVESLACGTPIVVADDAAPPELVSPSTGAIAQPHDPESLAEALKRALELANRPETVAECRRSAQQFDWESSIVPLLERVYESVIQ